MTALKELTARNFPSAEAEARAESVTGRYAGPESAYRLAFTDTDFLLREELRPVRFQLELLKPEMLQAEFGIHSTIVIFGSARLLSREDAAQRLAQARQALPMDDAARLHVKQAEQALAMSHYYEEARRLAHIATRDSADWGDARLTVVTGGGPGIMEAGNRGALEAGGHSIGLNIVLPHEQAPNPYITPELCFQFHYFAIRKMHFLMRSRALVCFPGGFGTMDELFEVLTLVQTGKSRRRPIVLFGRDHWDRVVNFQAMADAGMISPHDLDLIHFAERAEDAWEHICAFYDVDGGPQREEG